MPQSPAVAACLDSKRALQRAVEKARREGRPPEWYCCREVSQRWVGIWNEGATCYLNSLLQALFMLPEVRHEVLHFDYSEEKHGDPETCVPHQLGRLFARLQCSSLQAISARGLASLSATL